MRIQVGDVGLYFDVDGPTLDSPRDGVGERPTIVLLHTGPGGDHSLFKDSVGPQLTEAAQFVYVDLRGHGRSDRSIPASWNLATWRDDLGGFLEALEIERPVLLGVGISAMVALNLRLATRTGCGRSCSRARTRATCRAGPSPFSTG